MSRHIRWRGRDWRKGKLLDDLVMRRIQARPIPHTFPSPATSRAHSVESKEWSLGMYFLYIHSMKVEYLGAMIE